MRKLFTSESVTKGHPDKLCDYISDSVLDEYLKEDPYSRVACETLATKNEIIVTGEITSKAKNVNVEKIARKCIKEIGYDNENTDINFATCKVHINISNQSEDIKRGVDECLEKREDLGKLEIKDKKYIEGAGDQGIMFGFATDETEEFMPIPIYYAHKLAKRLEYVRENKILEYLRPDGKTQVTVEYLEKDKIRIEAIVVSTQHKDEVKLEKLRDDILKEVVLKVIPNELIDKNTKIYINPTGRFVIGGPLGDVGLTGRKIIVDTYGGFSKHGGGAFSGKDPTKVDRSAAYMARFLAKNIVANGYAKKCEISLSYAIGVAEPVSIYIDTFNTNTIPDDKILEKVKEKFSLTPSGIIEYLDLRKPIYKSTTCYGHFGKEFLPWEKIIKL